MSDVENELKEQAKVQQKNAAKSKKRSEEITEKAVETGKDSKDHPAVKMAEKMSGEHPIRWVVTPYEETDHNPARELIEGHYKGWSKGAWLTKDKEENEKEIGRIVKTLLDNRHGGRKQ